MKYRDYDVLVIERKNFSDFNLNDKFFASLRKDYNFDGFNFDNWFRKKQELKDYAFVYVNNLNNLIEGFLFLKIENEDEQYNDIFPKFDRKKRLKIGTFKIDSSGRLMGERFIKIIFDHAKINNINQIYLTILNNSDEKKRLIKLLLTFGFEKWGIKNSTNEEVYIKNFTFNNDSLKSYPLLNLENNIYILPIKPEYHTKLLPDCILANEWRNEYKVNLSWMNAIRKYYIGDNLWSENPKQNDLVLFYRTKPKNEIMKAGYKSIISGIGIIIKKSSLNLISEIEQKNIDKRSVLTPDEIKNFKNPQILEFLFVDNFSKRPTLNFLRELNIFDWNSGPRGLTKISKENLIKILKEADYLI